MHGNLPLFSPGWVEVRQQRWA